MTTYGYIRASKAHDLERPGMNPETQRRDLIAAGVQDATYTQISMCPGLLA